MLRHAALLLFILALFLLTGCWNRTELNELGILSATGIDGSPGKWTVTFQTVIPSSMANNGGASGGGVSSSPIHVYSTKTKTLREALVQSDMEYPRQLYFSHNNVVLIGEEAAKAGISEIVDLYLRNVDLRESVKVLIADGEANKLLKQFIPPERLPGSALSEIIQRESKLASIFPSVRMFDVALKLNDKSHAVAIPVISLSGVDIKTNETVDVYKEASSPAKLKLTRLAVFIDDKLAGSLNKEQSQGLMWIKGDVNNSTISFACEGSKTSSVRSSFRINKGDTHLTVSKEGKHYKFQAKAKVSGKLLESECLQDLDSQAVIKDMQKKIEDDIVSQMTTGWEAIQTLNADVPGIGDLIYRKYPKDWAVIQDAWEQQFKHIIFEPSVKVKITSIGLTKKSFADLMQEGERQ